MCNMTNIPMNAEGLVAAAEYSCRKCGISSICGETLKTIYKGHIISDGIVMHRFALIKPRAMCKLCNEVNYFIDNACEDYVINIAELTKVGKEQ